MILMWTHYTWSSKTGFWNRILTSILNYSSAMRINSWWDEDQDEGAEIRKAKSTNSTLIKHKVRWSTPKRRRYSTAFQSDGHLQPGRNLPSRSTMKQSNAYHVVSSCDVANQWDRFFPPFPTRILKVPPRFKKGARWLDRRHILQFEKTIDCRVWTIIQSWPRGRCFQQDGWN